MSFKKETKVSFPPEVNRLSELRGSDDPKTRHCAQCLKEVPTEVAEMCRGCNRRAYCSRKCREVDWVPGCGGQGHQVWCDLNCGEEDLDWEVRQVEGKGLGLFAKRPLKRLSRIMVDPNREKENALVQDLEPAQGSTDQKYELNSFLHVDFKPEGEEKKILFLCVRLSRANHDCHYSNAGFAFEIGTMVAIVFAEKEIDAGEEILIRYQSFNAVWTNWCNQVLHLHFKTKWTITCPPYYICQQEGILTMVQQSRELFLQLMDRKNEFSYEALEVVDKLLDNYEVINLSAVSTLRTLYDGFSIAVMKIETMGLAKDYANRFWIILCSVFPPWSQLYCNNEEWCRDVSAHPNYLMGELLDPRVNST